MKLYLLRHAIAELRGPNITDRNRRLTAQGVEELTEVVKALRKLKVAPDEILASPYRRAWETAVAANRVLRPGKKPAELSALTPSGSVAHLWVELKKHHAAKSVMLVGHEPLLSEFAAFLLNSPHLTINLKKSGLIRIDLHTVQIARPTGTLRWVLTASQLRRMA
jgi:phosphohistidine phosphatase